MAEQAQAITLTSEQAAALNLKFSYYDEKGLGESIRLTLTIGGFAFEDDRLPDEQFEARKKSGFFKFGQGPVLEIGGKQYAQSGALLAWAGKVTGLYPSDPLTALQVDEARQLGSDFMQSLRPVWYSPTPEAKQAAVKQISEVDAPKWLSYAEKLLESNGTGYFAGNSVTIADVLWYVFIDGVLSGYYELPASLITPFPNLRKLYDTVGAIPAVSAWNEKHPWTTQPIQ